MVAVEAAIDTVHDVAVIYPYTIYSLEEQGVVAVNVVGSGTLDGDVAEDDVLGVGTAAAGELQYAAILLCAVLAEYL